MNYRDIITAMKQSKEAPVLKIIIHLMNDK